jgi:hypothetical protein
VKFLETNSTTGAFEEAANDGRMPVHFEHVRCFSSFCSAAHSTRHATIKGLLLLHALVQLLPCVIYQKSITMIVKTSAHAVMRTRHNVLLLCLHDFMVASSVDQLLPVGRVMLYQFKPLRSVSAGIFQSRRISQLLPHPHHVILHDLHPRLVFA